MVIEFKRFDWDNGNRPKIFARFSVDEVEEFFNQDLFVHVDLAHSQTEKRFIAVGKGPDGRPMFVSFTLRSGKIRVISARYMRSKEAKKYETFKEKNEI